MFRSTTEDRSARLDLHRPGRVPILTAAVLVSAFEIALAAGGITAGAAQTDASRYAAQYQTDRWHSTADGTWYLYDESRTANVVNSWFQDLDGSWYLLAPGDGHMYAGLIHDTGAGRWYYCQTEHDGWYGRMAYVDGLYTVNGQTVFLAFNQLHDGTFGAIVSGLDQIRGTGLPVQEIAGIPTGSATARGDGTGNTEDHGVAANSGDAGRQQAYPGDSGSIGGWSGVPDWWPFGDDDDWLTEYFQDPSQWLGSEPSGGLSSGGQGYGGSDEALAEPAETPPMPAYDAPVTVENIMAVLDNLDPDGARIVRDASASVGSDMLLSWWSGQERITDALSTAVHEECHMATSSVMGFSQMKNRYYIGGGEYVTVAFTDVFDSQEMTETIPEGLRTFRFNNYVSPSANPSMASRQFGPYGLLDEYTAYCWGNNNALKTLDLRRRNGDSSVTNELLAQAEFRYYILHYMIYAREHHPEVYQGILNNDDFRRAFTSVDTTFQSIAGELFAKLPEYLPWKGDYDALMAEMAKPEYQEMVELLRP